MKVWKIRRRSLLLGALVLLVVFVGIHLATDIEVGGFELGGGVNEDVTGSRHLPSNQRIVTTPVVPTAILSATSILGHDSDIYLDGRAPSYR